MELKIDNFLISSYINNKLYYNIKEKIELNNNLNSILTLLLFLLQLYQYIVLPLLQVFFKRNLIDHVDHHNGT